MAISFPLSLPSVSGFASLEITPNALVGAAASDFTGDNQTYAWGTGFWTASAQLPEDMSRADAEDWAGWLASLNGMEGSFLAGDPLGVTGRGTWAGTPLLNGAHSARARSLTVDGFTASATGKRGDWIQFGSGSSTRLHKVLADFTANGSGQATIEVWPGLRSDLADNTALTVSAAKGKWMLSINGVAWTVRDVRIGGIVIPMREDLRGL